MLRTAALVRQRPGLMQIRRLASSQPQFRPHLPDMWKDANRTSPLKQGSFNKRRFAGHPEIFIALGCVAYAGFVGTRLMLNKSSAGEVRVPLWSRIWAPAESGYQKMGDEAGTTLTTNI